MAELKFNERLNGWAVFAGFMMVIAGIFQAFDGLVALLNNSFYVVAPNSLLVVDVTTWGWIHLLVGTLLFLAGLSLLGGGMFGRVLGIILATVSAVLNFVFLPAYPIWALSIIAIDVFIIYALAVHPIVEDK